MNRKLLLAVVAAIVLAGCGGQSAEQEVRNTVNNFTVDLGQQHYQAVCALATGQMLSDCAVFLNPLSASECRGAGQSHLGQACAAQQALTSTLDTFTGLTISKVVVQGSTATVAFSGSSEVMTVSKEGGKWRVEKA